MSADLSADYAADLHAMAQRLGLKLDPPVQYDLAEHGGHVLPGGRMAPCPLACGTRHGEAGSSCPVRFAPLTECYADHPWALQIKRQGTL